ncbi:hypothetical protein Tco_1295180 [Tanacetum coccineum]
MVKVRTTPDAITERSWGFEPTKAIFMKEVIPFIKTLRELFNDFDNGLNLELNEVKTIFNQMEAVVEQCSEKREEEKNGDTAAEPQRVAVAAAAAKPPKQPPPCGAVIITKHPFGAVPTNQTHPTVAAYVAGDGGCGYERWLCRCYSRGSGGGVGGDVGGDGVEFGRSKGRRRKRWRRVV